MCDFSCSPSPCSPSQVLCGPYLKDQHERVISLRLSWIKILVTTYCYVYLITVGPSNGLGTDLKNNPQPMYLYWLTDVTTGIKRSRRSPIRYDVPTSGGPLVPVRIVRPVRFPNLQWRILGPCLLVLKKLVLIRKWRMTGKDKVLG